MAHLQRRLQLVNSVAEADWLEQSIKVAFATSDLQVVDQHFGAAESFAIYHLDANHTLLFAAAKFGTLAMDGNEEKLAAKINALSGCLAVYSQAIGASAIAQLRTKNIQPIKVPSGTSIIDLLGELQDELQQGPQGWLGRALAKRMPADSERFDEMDAEGWSE